jgi:outer membrane receptor protein involved in Fe transport
VGGPYLHYDTTLTARHGYWLPDVILRYKPLPWFDVRLSYTNTLAYPDYNAIVPRIDISTGGAIAWNNYRLVPSRSTNYDLYLSFYENTIGLFTAGGFLKRIKDLIYPWTLYVSGAGALPYFPPFYSTTAPSGTYSVATYVNDSYRIDNWGIELDWQTHFWY